MPAITANPAETASFECEVLAAIEPENFFVLGKPFWVARAPGRLDVMGGNVDYTGGMVLQSLLREAIWVAVQPRSDDTIRVLNPGAAQFGWEPRLELKMSGLRDPESLQQLCEEAGSRWGCYVLGAVYFLIRFYGCETNSGIDLFLVSDLPPNKGVSSSAALEVATLKAVAAAWGVDLHGVALATAGQWVENIVCGAACGIMDQAAIVCGEENRLLPILCQPCRVFSPIALPEGIRIWGIDSLVSRSTTGVAYEKARAAAFMGYKLISQRMGIEVVQERGSKIPRWSDSRWNGYLSNLAPSQFRDRFERWLPELLTGHEFLERAGEHVDPFTRINPREEYPVRAAVRYASEENLRVRMLFTLFEAPWNESGNSLQLAGELLLQSHVAYAECGLGSEACDELVARALDAGLPGAKMTGGGAGGVVAVLGRVGDQHTVQTIVREFAAQQGAVPHLFEGSSSGTDAFGVRIIEPAPHEKNAIVATLQRREQLPAVMPLMAANLLWAGQGVAVKLLAGALSPLAIALLPLDFITLVGLMLLCSKRDAGQRFRAAWRFRGDFFLAGICGQFIAQVGMTLGISWSSASNGAILSLLIPIFGALLAVWLLHERLSGLRVVVLLLGVAGIFLVSPLKMQSRFASHHEFAGNILIALGCVGSAFYNVFSKRLLTHFSSFEILFFSYLSTTIFSLPALFLLEPHCLSNLARLTATQWSALLYLAIFLYGVSMVLFLKALRMVDVVIASASLCLTPLFGVALAHSVLKERLTPQAVLGSGVILFATLILFRFDAPAERSEPIVAVSS